jgi:putative ABC transport system permease protein
MGALLRQCLVVFRLGLSGLKVRSAPAFVIVAGMACMVGVLLSMLSVARGFLRIYEIAGDPARAIVLSAGARYESGSSISLDDLKMILGAPRIRKTPLDALQMSAELSVQIPVDGFAGGALNARGIGPEGASLRPGFRIVAGRYFRPGVRELIVGVGAERAFHLSVGSHIIMPDGEWPIVGSFSAAGGLVESELLADAATLMASSRNGTFNSVLVDLQSSDSFDMFDRWLASNPGLRVKAERQPDYYRRTSAEDADFFNVLAYTVGTIMAIGALFGAAKILYAMVNMRIREIATLRAIGFAASAVAVSVLLEGMLLSLAGGALGAGLAWLAFDGRLSSYMNSVFHLAVTPQMVALGLAWAATLAIIGGAIPALRAGRLQVAAALRPE